MARATLLPGHSGIRTPSVRSILGPCGPTPPATSVPSVTSVTPSSGSTSGGTAVTIIGTNFAGGATVSFGGTAASNVVVASSTTITATTPAGSSGAVAVSVTVSGQTGSLASGFTYSTTPPASGSGIVYDLRTDRTILQVATLAAPSAAGQSVVDPTFNTTITRITDQNTPGAAGGMAVDGASFKNNWSSDGQYFNVAGGVLFRRDGTWIRTLPFNPWFSFQTSNLMFGPGGAGGGFGIVQFDYLSNQSTMLFNLDGGSFPNRTANGPYNGIVVGDYADDHFSIYFNGGMQDKYRTLTVYRRSSNTYAVMDLDASLVGGWFSAGTPWPSMTSSMHALTDQNGVFTIPNQGIGGPSDGFHSIEIDRTGRYVWIGLNCYLQATDFSGWASPTYIWDLNTMTFFRWTGGGNNNAPFPSGHSCTGFGEVVNAGGAMPEVGTGNWTTAGAYLRPLNFSTLPTNTGIINLVPSPTAAEWQGNVDSHVSWASVQPGQHTPILMSQYLGGDSPYSSPSLIPANRLYDNEITAMDPDSLTIYRVCHHRAWYTGDFNTGPHGNVSRQGDKFIFTSNWLGTLQGGRYDVFMVTLPIV